VRTSPDHGVAFDIAGKNQADESSFREAIFRCIDIINYRKNYEDNRKNPLKKISKAIVQMPLMKRSQKSLNNKHKRHYSLRLY
jgi:hypothetical protein